MHDNPILNNEGEIVKAGCVVLNDNNEILLVADKKGEHWALPKGHAEEGENPEQIALREIEEETGYVVQIIKPLSDLAYTNDKINMPIRIHIFLAKVVADHGEGEDKWGWFSLDKAKTLVWDNIRDYLEQELD